MNTKEPEETKKLVLLDCKKHWGLVPGKCRKCEYFAKVYTPRRLRKYYQTGGTPYVALIS